MAKWVAVPSQGPHLQGGLLVYDDYCFTMKDYTTSFPLLNRIPDIFSMNEAGLHIHKYPC